MTDMWHCVLSGFNAMSEKLRSASCELKAAVDLLKSLIAFPDNVRDRFDEFEARGIEMCGTSVYQNSQMRCRKIAKRPGNSMVEGVSTNVKYRPMSCKTTFKILSIIPVSFVWINIHV
jgi:hypothetical protein